ncbi:MAG TPA: pyocin knob domain-containing protein [Buttiauxella sp.]|jgi:hypothetical protein
MAEDYYSALMMRRALPTTQNIKAVTAPGIYPVDAGNTTAPGSQSGTLLALLPTAATKLLFIGSDGNTYKPTSTGWQAFGDVRKVNGHTADTSGAVTVTSQDIFNDQAIAIPNAADLNDYTTPGLYYQNANAQAASGKNYPESNSGTLEIYKNAGTTQVYRVYSSSRTYCRALYGGSWSKWGKVYDTENKPTAADTGAVAKTGDTMTGPLTAPGLNVKQQTANTAFVIYFALAEGGNLGYIGQGTTTKDIYISNYTGNNNLALKADGGIDIRGGSTTANISVTGNLNPTSFATFDNRYASKLDVYSKTVSDGKYIAGFRFASYGATGGDLRDSAKTIMTGIYATNGYNNPTTHEHRIAQYLLNGAWINVPYV